MQHSNGLREAATAALMAYDTFQPLDRVMKDLCAALAEQQEPVADALIRAYIAALVANSPDEAANATKAMVDYVYTAPQPRRRLTTNEVLNLMPESIPADHDGALMEFARAIEAAVWETPNDRPRIP